MSHMPTVTAPATMTADSLTNLPNADVLAIRELLDEKERATYDHLHNFLQTEIRPVVGEYWDREEFPFALLERLGEEGLGGLEHSGSSRLLRGLIYAEVTRADVSLSALVGIHNELVLDLIAELGSEEQKNRWLPGLRTFADVGCFALTEPEHGSDVAGGLTTTATPVDGGWVINGEKRWIGAGTFADFAIVFARDTTDDAIKGFIVELDLEGVRREKISSKMGLRIMQNADIFFDDVKVPQGAVIPGAQSFKDTNIFLRNSRAWVGWQAAGLQLAIFDTAREYAVNRDQFGRKIAKFQLIQEKLARILGNASASLSIMVQVARLQESGSMEMHHAAMAKGTNTRFAREAAALGREMLGGNGIVTDYEMSKLFNDAEILYTYEGTYDINALITARAVTGVSAFV